MSYLMKRPMAMKRSTRNTSNSWLKKQVFSAKEVLASPVAFFKGQHSAGSAFLYVIVLTAAQTLLSIFFGSWFYESWDVVFHLVTGKVLPAIPPGPLFYPVVLALGSVLWLLALAVLTLILHACFKLFGESKAHFSSTINAVCYGATPTLVIGWIPYLNYVGTIWSMVLIGIGMHEQHRIAEWRFLLMIAAVILIFVAAGLFVMGY